MTPNKDVFEFNQFDRCFRVRPEPLELCKQYQVLNKCLCAQSNSHLESKVKRLFN